MEIPHYVFGTCRIPHYCGVRIRFQVFVSDFLLLQGKLFCPFVRPGSGDFLDAEVRYNFDTGSIICRALLLFLYSGWAIAHLLPFIDSQTPRVYPKIFYSFWKIYKPFQDWNSFHEALLMLHASFHFYGLPFSFNVLHVHHVHCYIVFHFTNMPHFISLCSCSWTHWLFQM